MFVVIKICPLTVVEVYMPARNYHRDGMRHD
jgi:hypothetical protein